MLKGGLNLGISFQLIRHELRRIGLFGERGERWQERRRHDFPRGKVTALPIIPAYGVRPRGSPPFWPPHHRDR